MRRNRFAWWAITPFAGIMLLFGIFPMLQLLRMSVSDVNIQQGSLSWRYAGLDNFRKLITDDAVRESALVTATFIMGTVPLTVLFGTLLALLVHRAKLLSGLAKNVILWPAVIAPVVVSLMWLLILSSSVGALNRVMSSTGLPTQAWLGSRVGAMTSVIAVDVWHWTPIVFLLVLTALQGMDAEILEAARVDGASEVALVRYVILPMLRPVIGVAILIRLVMSVKAFDEMFLLTRGGPDGATNLISLHIRTVFFDRLQLGYGAAMSVGVVLIVGFMLLMAAMARRLVARGGIT